MRPALAAAAATAISAAVCSGCTSGSSGRSGAPSTSVITSTTQIAGAGVLGNQRRPDESCAPQPADSDPGPATRAAPNAAGVQPDVAHVPADPQRIVVLSGDQLDALCALGLQSRIVAAALPARAAITPAKPDLILGSQALTPKLYSALAAIAPTVFTAAPGAAWQDNLLGVGAATARAGAANALIDGFTTMAHDDGAAHDAP